MSKFVKRAAVSTAALVMVAATAPASLAADRLEIRDFVGTINWTNGPMSVEVQKNAGETKISGRRSVSVDGGQSDIDESGCKSSYGKYDLDWFGKRKEGRFGGFENLDDLPVLDITLPENATLILENSIVFTSGAPNLGAAELELKYCGDISLGDVAGEFALDSRGSADVEVGKTGQLVANLKGSGDLTGGDSGDVLIRSHGSADIELEHLASFEAKIHGSGDITAGNVDGTVDLASHGSGDVELGDVTGRLSYTGYGSGNLDISSVEGDILEVESFGSGDIDISGGEVDRVIATVRGSAEIDFAGAAQNAKLSASGSGDIYIERVLGEADMKTSGSGDIDIDERG